MSSYNKTKLILDWLLPLLYNRSGNSPFFLGLTGLQGSGKSTLVSQLKEDLCSRGFQTVQFSLDDLYLTHTQQIELARLNPTNELLQSRGQFGTHDVSLAAKTFADLRENVRGTMNLPSYDKSQFHGQGDRRPPSQWPEIALPLDVVIFEGWGVGFQPLSATQVEEKWTKAIKDGGDSTFIPRTVKTTVTLAQHSLGHLQTINNALQENCLYFMGRNHIDALVYLKAEKLEFVYEWREQQEHALRSEKGTGMTSAQVIAFVQRYMPSYELYLSGLETGIFEESGKQMNIEMGDLREIIKVKVI